LEADKFGKVKMEAFFSHAPGVKFIWQSYGAEYTLILLLLTKYELHSNRKTVITNMLIVWYHWRKRYQHEAYNSPCTRRYRSNPLMPVFSPHIFVSDSMISEVPARRFLWWLRQHFRPHQDSRHNSNLLSPKYSIYCTQYVRNN
jgi:hypothetical protein